MLNAAGEDPVEKAQLEMQGLREDNPYSKVQEKSWDPESM